MAGMLFGFPFNEEIFDYNWRTAPNPVNDALVASQVVQDNAEIAAQVAGGSDVFTIPFYNKLGGTPANYDGETDIPEAELDGGYQSGIVYGRLQGWKARDFIVDYNSGANPMAQIAAQVATFWHEDRQQRILKVLNAVFGVTDTNYTENLWADHVLDISASGTTVSAANKLGATTAGDAITKACGDLGTGKFAMAFMHSTVANNLAGLELLEFRKYTDPNGVQRQLNIADWNGLTVVAFDGVPHTAASSSAAAKYTTYLLGPGAIQAADAKLTHPAAEPWRDPKHLGGEDMLYTRVRRGFLVNGFTYTKQSGDKASPTDTQLAQSSRYSLIHDPKCIGLAKIVSNG